MKFVVWDRNMFQYLCMAHVWLHVLYKQKQTKQQALPSSPLDFFNAACSYLLCWGSEKFYKWLQIFLLKDKFLVTCCIWQRSSYAFHSWGELIPHKSVALCGYTHHPVALQHISIEALLDCFFKGWLLYSTWQPLPSPH